MGCFCACGDVLIQEATTPPCPAVAVELVVIVLDGELVVISELFAPIDLPQCKDDNVLAPVHVDDSRVAVWLARVVDEAGGVALHRCIHHVKVVNAEHVTADTLMQNNKQNRASPYSHISLFFFNLWLFLHFQCIQLKS